MPTRRATADERLRRYREKRDFSITAEPHGTDPPTADGWRFVVQRHRASRLHYDLRLEAAGVLVSWAVPKGPTLDPGARRLAVHVEDHPLDYYDFEGVIAAGEYGGGDVIVWDWGTWALSEGDDPVGAIDDGDLHLAFDGEKLHGRFVLVRRGDDKQWLLIKKRDDAAVAGWDPEEHPRSVKSGRTNDEVLDAPAASWTGRASWAGATADELAALDALGPNGMWSIGGRDIRLADLDAEVAPGRRGGRPISRRDLVRHGTTMAPALLAYVADRPLDVSAAPKLRPPDWMRSEGGGRGTHVVADSAAALAWLAGHGVVDLRPSIAIVGEPERVGWVAFELGAGGRARRADVLAVAQLHRTALEHLGLDGRPVVIGGSRIEILVPVGPGSTRADAQHFVDTVTAAIAASAPDLVAHAGGAYAQTFLAPFSAVSTAGAPVAVPVTWDELDGSGDHWTVRDAGDRLAGHGDPLASLIGSPQRLPSLDDGSVAAPSGTD